MGASQKKMQRKRRSERKSSLKQGEGLQRCSSHPGRLFCATCDARLLCHKTQDDPYGRIVNCVINKWGAIFVTKLSKETPFFLPLIEMFLLKLPSLSTTPPFVCAYCYCLHFYTAVIYYLLKRL